MSPTPPTAARKYHFISGLPRSGSTLLSAILRQNPRFEAGMTSPVGSFYTAVQAQFSAGSEFGSVMNNTQRRNVLRGLFDSYYTDCERPVVFDTNRQWSARLGALLGLFPESKLIACARNVAWVMDSMERQYRANPYENTTLFGAAGARSTVYQRLEGLAQHDQTVGFAWAALREAFFGEHAKSLLIVDYELLTQSPKQVIDLVYRFLGEAPFEHDFDAVEYDAPDFDQRLGVPGLHKVKPKVEHTERRTILPPDLFEKYAKLTFWTDPAGTAANVIAPRSPVSQDSKNTGQEGHA
jgi:sulfotransferase